MAENSPQTDRGIIAWFTNNPVAANLMMLMVMLLGLYSLSNLRQEAMPSLAPSDITISVTYEVGSAEEASRSIAEKIEDALKSVPGIKHITSESTAMGSTVTVERTSGYDLDRLMRDVKAKVDAVNDLPSDADNPVVEEQTRQDHALSIALYGHADQQTLQTLAEKLRRDLLTKPGISQVDLSGTKDKMVSVEVDEAALQSYNLSLSDISDAISANSGVALTASVRGKRNNLNIKASDQLYYASQFADIPVKTLANGARLKLGQIATVTDGFDDRKASLLRFQGLPSVGLQITMTSTNDISHAVKQAMQVIDEWKEDSRLPTNVQLTTWYDKSQIIKDRLNLLLSNAGQGILFVFIALALFLNIRVAFWVSAGLPFIFLGTLFMMNDSLLGLTLNSITTFGFILALGIVVDDAVVIGESVYTTRSREGDTLLSTIKGAQTVAIPTTFGVLTTIAAFIPLSMIEGNMGRLYSQFAFVVACCLIFSLIEAKLILPAHLAHLKTHTKGRGNPLSRLWGFVQKLADGILQQAIQRLYIPLLRLTLRFRYAALALFIAAFIVVIGMPFSGAVRFAFFPAISGDVIRASFTLENDASYGYSFDLIDRMESAAYRTADELKQKYGLDKDLIKHLQLSVSDDLSGSITAQLISANSLPFPLTEFANRWREQTGAPPYVRQIKFNARFEGPADFRAELRMDDSQALYAAARDLKARLQETSGIFDLQDSISPGQPQYYYHLNASGRALGLTNTELARQIYQALFGREVQNFQLDSDEIKVRVRYPQDDRDSLTDLDDLRLHINDQVLPLAAIATRDPGFNIDSVTRIDGSRALYIEASVDKSSTSPQQIINKLKADYLPQLEHQYPGLSIHFAGEAEQQQETSNSLFDMSMLALFAIYILLAIPLKSYYQPLLIMLAIPFGICGAILGHWWNDLTLSILSLNGILALAGVVVNDSLMLVSRFNGLRNDATNIDEHLVETCTGRFRAIMLTSITTYGGLVPLLSETSLQAKFLIPAAASMGYGILFATLITLLLIPALLRISHDVGMLKQQLQERFIKRNTSLPESER